jgi:hypothetical protein|nr:hypothetical protein [Kofleriaceae bacterium]
MVYRDTSGDLRTAELRSLVATEPDLQDAARQVRFEQDEANEAVDRLGRDLADAERGLERAQSGGIRALFARGTQASETAVFTLRDALDVAMAQLDELVAKENTIRAQLEAVTAARAELKAREASAAAELRASDNPAGADYRALDAAIAREAARIEAIERALRAIEHADVATAAVVQSGQDAADARAGRGPMMLVLAQADDLTIDARIRDAIAFARDQLLVLDSVLDRLGLGEPALVHQLPRDEARAFAEAARFGAADMATQVAHAAAVARQLSTLLTSVAGERDRIRARRADLESRQRDAAARYLGVAVPTTEVA